MQSKTRIYGGAALALGVAALVWAFAPRALEVEVATVTQGRFEAGIDEEARTRLRDRYTLSAPLQGRLARITLREGDAVQAGEVVARLSPTLSPMLDERTLREQQARVEMAEANQLRAAARIERTRVALEQARQELRRSEQLTQQGFVAATKLDTDRLNLTATQQDTEAALQEQHVAKHELEQARAALGAVRQSGNPAGNASFALRAPIAGQVLRVAQSSETMVTLGTPLLDIGDTTQLEVLAQLLSTDAMQVAPGYRVRIDRWGAAGTLQGRVRRIEPAAFTKVSALGVEEQRVNVLIDLTSPPAQLQALGDGYRVAVRVITREAANATLVPLSALFPLPDAANGDAGANGASAATDDVASARLAVFVVDGGRVNRVPVQLEARGNTQAWVRQGLTPGMQVVIYPPAELKPGARVSVRSP